jgi:hypothetical protein
VAQAAGGGISVGPLCGGWRCGSRRSSFSQRTDDGFPAEPYPIDIPQYAIWRDEDGTKIPMIVVQAERHIADKDGDPIFGLRGLDGESIVATAPEVELLGTAIPRR